MPVFHDFFSFYKFEKPHNIIFIALIPKIVGVIELKNFHPISLVSGIYKVIFKVLANHLSTVLKLLYKSPKSPKINSDFFKTLLKYPFWFTDNEREGAPLIAALFFLLRIENEERARQSDKERRWRWRFIVVCCYISNNSSTRNDLC